MNKLPILISYAYRGNLHWDVIERERDSLNLIIDSGAFTAFKQNKPVKLKDYQLWLEKIIPTIKPAGYFTLDVIGAPEQTKQNYLQMLKDGFKPIPIFTRGTPKEDLDFYFDRSETVGIGGIQMKSNNARGYLNSLMKSVGGRSVHLLGYTIHEDLMAFKPKSADSSNWKSAALFGSIALHTPQGFVTATRKTFWKYSGLISDLGYTPDDLRNEDAWRGGEGLAHYISSASYLGYVERLKKRLNVNLHMVVAKVQEFTVLTKVFKQRNKK